MLKKLLLVVLFIIPALAAFPDDPDPFILPEVVFEGRSTPEDRVTFSTKVDVDYLLDNSSLLTARLGLEVDANQFGFSYGTSYGYIINCENGIEDVFGAFFGVDDDYAVYSELSGTAVYNKMHILEGGIIGRQLSFDNRYIDSNVSPSDTIDEEEMSHEILVSIGYRYLAVHDTLLPVFQDLSFSVKALAGFYFFEREVLRDGAIDESVPMSTVFSFGAIAEIKYYLFTAEFGFLNNIIYWSAGMRIPFSIFL